MVTHTAQGLDERAQAQSAFDAYLEKATVTAVHYRKRQDYYHVHIESAQFPLRSVYQALCNRLATQIPQRKAFACIPRCTHMTGPAAERFPLDLFREVLGAVYPQDQCWLKALSWIWDEEVLTVETGSRLLFDKLEKQHFAAHVRWVYAQMCDEPLSFTFRFNEQLAKAEAAKASVQVPRPAAQPSGGVAKEIRDVACRGSTIYGKTVKGEVRQIIDITEEENAVVCEGSLFELEMRTFKSGRSLIAFNLTDQSDSITCKLFANKDEAPGIYDALSKVDAVKISGNAETDRYTQELTIMCRHINGASLLCRVDNAPEKRVELHLHTQMSNMDGVGSLKSLVALAAQLGHEAIAITDHGVVQSFPEAYRLGKKYGIKIIYGMEAYIFDDSIPENQKPRTYHCILLAKNNVGLRNLYKLVTESHLRYFKRRPRIPKRLLSYAREGLVIGSACEAGELFQYMIQHPNDREGLDALADFYDYIEIQPLDNNAFMIAKGFAKDRNELMLYNTRLRDVAERLNKPLVATCDVHFTNAEDSIYRGILMAGKGFADAEDQAPLYYRTTQEMLEEFSYLGDEAYDAVIHNPKKIVQDFEALQPVPDDLFAPEIEGAEEEIETLTMEKAKRLYGDPLPDIVDQRIQKELKAIIGNGFSVLYLIAQKLVKKSNEDGYVVGSRGSVGSSVVAYLTDITEVNALPPHHRCPHCLHSIFDDTNTFDAGADMPNRDCPKCGTQMVKDGFDIPFEIFLGFKGEKVPDIDLNFSGDYQSSAHQYTEELFGKDNVFRAGTIATVKDKTAFGYVRKFYEERGIVRKNAELKRLTLGCTGVKRTTGQHPGGQMVVPRGIDVHAFTPLQRPADDVKTETVTTHFDYHSISERLVKLDILGHDDPTVIKMLEDLTDVSVQSIPLDDPETLSLFSSIDILQTTKERLNTSIGTYGIPEFNTKFVRQMLEDTKPKRFADLVRISGFSHGTDVWLNNAQDLIKGGIADVSETISTRDDIMIYLIRQGMQDSLAFSIMESVRKGRGLSDSFEESMEAANIAPWFIESCKKIKYLFPKAHAVAYVTMAFRIAWFKINRPLAFYASYFSVRGADDFDAELILKGEAAVKQRIKDIYASGLQATAKDQASVSVLEVALEMYARGYQFWPIDLQQSDATRFKILDNGLIPPFTGLGGLGKTMALNIVAGRSEKNYTSVEDLKKRGHVGDAMIQEMKRLNMLRDMPESDQILLF